MCVRAHTQNHVYAYLHEAADDEKERREIYGELTEFQILLRMLWHGNTTVAVSTNHTYVTNIRLQWQGLWRLRCSKMWYRAVWEMCTDTSMASLGLQERVSNQWQAKEEQNFCCYGHNVSKWMPCCSPWQGCGVCNGRWVTKSRRQ